MSKILVSAEYGYGKYKSFFSKRARFLLKELGFNDSELSLTLCGQATIKDLNQEYRKLNKVTDVLSFPLDDNYMLGDVVISIPQSMIQAERYDATIEEEFLRLLIHGVLHLLGFDHVGNVKKAKVMRAKEEELFESVIRKFKG